MVVAMKIVDSTLESRFLKSAFCHPHHPLTLIDSEDDYCIQCRLLKCQSLSTTAPFRTMLAWVITFYPLMNCTTFDIPKGSGNMGPSSYQRNSSKVDNSGLSITQYWYLCWCYWLKKKLQPEFDELVLRNLVINCKVTDLSILLMSFFAVFMLQEILGSSTDFGSTVVAVVSIAGCVMKRHGNFLRMLVQL